MAASELTVRQTAEEVEDDEFMLTAQQIMKSELEYTDLRRVQQVRGGIINKATIYESNQGKIFVKYAKRDNARGMFDSEMESLKAIQSTNAIRVPRPIKVFSHPDRGAFFVMECIENLKEMDKHWDDLGLKFARLHNLNPTLLQLEKNSNSVHNQAVEEPVRKFGFSLPTYMGHKFQTQAVWCDTWEEYWVRHMLKPQFDELEQTGDRELVALWSELQLHIHKVFTDINIAPSLLHGDFCSINVGEINKECILYDPTSFYGHHENDFTILHMEENFPKVFYQEYEKILPKQAGYKNRKLAYLLSAYTLCTNAGYDAKTMRKLALQTGRTLLTTLVGH